MADLNGKIVLITAAAQGIGRASVEAFVRAGAKVIATDINQAKLAELDGMAGVTGIDRVEGFSNRIKEAYPNIEIVSVQYGGGDQLQSTEITKSILLANPDLKGIFGANEGSVLGVANGKQELGSNVVVIGYDSGAAQKALIESGVIAGAITQNPVGIGYQTVQAAVSALKGEKVKPRIEVQARIDFLAMNPGEEGRSEKVEVRKKKPDFDSREPMA